VRGLIILSSKQSKNTPNGSSKSTMKNPLLPFLLVATTTTATTTNTAAVEHFRDNSHRKLILDFCPDVPIVDCICQTTIFPPIFSSTCTLEEDEGVLCAPIIDGLCGVPTLITSFDIFRLFSLQLPVGAELCYKDWTIFGLPGSLLGLDLCIDFFDPLGSFMALFGFGGGTAGRAKNLPKTSYGACSAKIGNTACESCEVCNNGSGGTSLTLRCGDVELSSCTTILAAPLPKSVGVAPNLTLP
jgi:hypothetical protein